MKQALFQEFSASSKATWKQQAIKELKGKEIETLHWKTTDNLVFEPYYTNEDLEGIPLEAIQACQKTSTGWQNRIMIANTDEKIANLAAKNVLEQGANAVCFIVCQETNLSKLLHGIKLSEIPVYFLLEGSLITFLEKLTIVAPYRWKGGILSDTLTDAFVEGNTSEILLNSLSNCLQSHNSADFRLISVKTTPFHEAGATPSQEIAFGLASVLYYFDKLTDAHISPQIIADQLEITISVGTDYFMEIAKIRAFRYLFANLAKAYYVQESSYRIHAENSFFYDAAITPNTNMLRATTEAMAAIMGGCDSLSIHPYNAVLDQADDFSERVARNISTILKEESYLDKTTDVAAGSYYIETLTHQLAENAWKLFLEIEDKGGIWAVFENGWMAESIKNARKNQEEQLASTAKIMIGVNKFRYDETPFIPTYHPIAQKPNQLPKTRLSVAFEQ